MKYLGNKSIKPLAALSLLLTILLFVPNIAISYHTTSNKVVIFYEKNNITFLDVNAIKLLLLHFTPLVKTKEYSLKNLKEAIAQNYNWIFLYNINQNFSLKQFISQNNSNIEFIFITNNKKQKGNKISIKTLKQNPNGFMKMLHKLLKIDIKTATTTSPSALFAIGPIKSKEDIKESYHLTKYLKELNIPYLLMLKTQVLTKNIIFDKTPLAIITDDTKNIQPNPKIKLLMLEKPVSIEELLNNTNLPVYISFLSTQIRLEKEIVPAQQIPKIQYDIPLKDILIIPAFTSIEDKKDILKKIQNIQAPSPQDDVCYCFLLSPKLKVEDFKLLIKLLDEKNIKRIYNPIHPIKGAIFDQVNDKTKKTLLFSINITQQSFIAKLLKKAGKNSLLLSYFLLFLGAIVGLIFYMLYKIGSKRLRRRLFK